MLTVRQVHCFWQPNKSWYEINGFHRSMHCIYTVCEIWLHIVCPQMVRSMNSVDWIEYDWMHTNGWPSISIFIRMQSTLAKWIFAPFNPTNRYCTHTQFNFYTHCVFAQARGLHVCSSLHMQQQQDVYPFSTFFCFLFFFLFRLRIWNIIVYCWMPLTEWQQWPIAFAYFAFKFSEPNGIKS